MIPGFGGRVPETQNQYDLTLETPGDSKRSKKTKSFSTSIFGNFEILKSNNLKIVEKAGAENHEIPS